MTKTLAALALLAYIGTIVFVNWLVEHYGLVPVGFGLMAPAGVFAAGASFTFRDWLQELAGRETVMAAIAVGAVFSWFIAPSFALASAVAFFCAELIDLSIYTPLRERRRYIAVILSNAAGSVIDSMLFLWLAFGSITYWEGQVVGKLWTILPAVGLLWLWRNFLSGRLKPSQADPAHRADVHPDEGLSQ